MPCNDDLMGELMHGWNFDPAEQSSNRGRVPAKAESQLPLANLTPPLTYHPGCHLNFSFTIFKIQEVILTCMIKRNHSLPMSNTIHAIQGVNIDLHNIFLKLNNFL